MATVGKDFSVNHGCFRFESIRSQVLPDESVQDMRVIGHVVEELGGRQTIALQHQFGLGRLHLFSLVGTLELVMNPILP